TTLAIIITRKSIIRIYYSKKFDYFLLLVCFKYLKYFSQRERRIIMKSTGMIRKVDDLGRVVIPIELRRSLKINEKDPIEIYVDDDKIILKKYVANKSGDITGEIQVDEISRIAIPNEIRRSLKINEKHPIEIYVDDDKSILKKYVANMSCDITGESTDDNIALANGKIVLSPDGAKELVDEINKQFDL